MTLFTVNGTTTMSFDNLDDSMEFYLKEKEKDENTEISLQWNDIMIPMYPQVD